MKPPIAYPPTRPRSHRIIRTAAIVSSIRFPFDMLIKRDVAPGPHDPPLAPGDVLLTNIEHTRPEFGLANGGHLLYHRIIRKPNTHTALPGLVPG